MPSSNDIKLLRLARRCKWLNRRIIQEECHPDDKDGSATRDMIRRFVLHGWLRKVEIKPNEYVSSCAPLYLPTECGCALLATETQDFSLLLDRQPSIRNPQDFPHYLGVSRLINEMDKGFATQSVVELSRLVLEHDIVNPEEKSPEKRRMLATMVGTGKRGGQVWCKPDFATLVRVGSSSWLYTWEFETGSETSPARCGAKKSPGHLLYHQQGVYKELFPGVPGMKVIVVCPNEGWREAFRRSIRERPGAELWLAVSRGDVRRDGAFLREAVFWPAKEDAPRPLIRQPAAPSLAPLAVALGGAGGGGVSSNGKL